MNRSLILALALCLVSAARVSAASFHIISHGNSSFSVHFDGSPHNSDFDTLYFSAKPGMELRAQLIRAGILVEELNYVPSLADPLAPHWSSTRQFDRIPNFGGFGFPPRPPGQQGSYINQLLGEDPLDYEGALGWTMLGVVTSPTHITFAGTPLGQTISTVDQPDGRLFLANFYIPIPEPAAATLIAMLAMALLGPDPHGRRS